MCIPQLTLDLELGTNFSHSLFLTHLVKAALKQFAISNFFCNAFLVHISIQKQGCKLQIIIRRYISIWYNLVNSVRLCEIGCLSQAGSSYPTVLLFNQLPTWVLWPCLRVYSPNLFVLGYFNIVPWREEIRGSFQIYSYHKR